MSLNWKEIDLILAELDLVGAKIERVIQPTFDSLSLGLFKAGLVTELYISIAQGACRIHALSSAPPKPTRPLRFMECLKSRIRGGHIDSIAQLGEERIVKLELTVPRSIEFRERDPVAPLGFEYQRLRLYARLWSGAGNVILVDEDGVIVDALARRPKRGEISGRPFAIEEELAQTGSPRSGRSTKRPFEPRELPGNGSFNRRVEAYYAQRGGELSRERLLESARERFAKRSSALEARIAELSTTAAEFRESERLRELGDILLANPSVAYEGTFAPCEDFYRGGLVLIPVDPRLTAVENARALFERHKKAKSGLSEVEAELASVQGSVSRLRAQIAALEAEEDPLLIARALAKGGTTRPSAGGGHLRRSYPGLSLDRGGWTILVGRSAKENDELLRRHVKGSDLWLHARDWPGSYVFVKGRKGKSVPLEVLLDAGMLAIYYSKGRSSGGGDLYYAFAKYLRRAKDGPKGLVLPTHEKNLSVKIDEARIKSLLALIGDSDIGL
jgi:predicted ribosome quality control (RQC) complex YloA/Tae2 family protein